jgi:hypothetical protein
MLASTLGDWDQLRVRSHAAAARPRCGAVAR